VDTILQTGAQPLMCICFKPRLLFPKIDHDIVEPNDYEAWQDLIFRLVRHYRERGNRVQFWEVANEPDIGEDGGCPYRFKPESYVRYYERTVSAILKADPETKVGGPAVASVRSGILPALLNFCDTNQVPLHFVSWHIYNSNPKAIRDTITYAKGLLAKHPRLKPETMLNEWNMDLTNPPLDPRFQPCFISEVIWQMKEGGLDYSCYYHIRDWYVDPALFTKFMSPQGVAFMARWWNRMPQFDGLFDYQNNPRPSYFAFKLLSRLDGERLELVSRHPNLRGFAAHDEQMRMYNVMLWNFSSAPLTAQITFADLPKDFRMRHLVLDAQTGSNDENARLRPEAPRKLPKGEYRFHAEFEPYGVQFWMLE
jgi:xylan 1,4-beta-xylosidase